MTSSDIITHMKTSILASLILLCLMATPALAQFDVGSITNTKLSIELKPQFPHPGEEVTATLNDYSGGAYGSSITWVVNGNEILSSKNHRETTFKAGAVGTTQTIEAVLTKPSGGNQDCPSYY